jgi:hypothetical protein
MTVLLVGGFWSTGINPALFGMRLLQTGPAVDVSAGSPLLNVVGSAIGAFLTTLLVGAIMVAVAPEYTHRRMEQVVDQPLACFGYGIVALVFIVLVTIVLVVTIIGIVIAIPFVILSYVVWAIGSAIAFLAIGDRLVGHDEGWTRPLLIGAGINGLLTLTGIGGLVSFGAGATGFGAVLRTYLE